MTAAYTEVSHAEMFIYSNQIVEYSINFCQPTVFLSREKFRWSSISTLLSQRNGFSLVNVGHSSSRFNGILQIKFIKYIDQQHGFVS